MKIKQFLSTLLLLLVITTAMAQTRQITGTVYSKSDGETIIGATVREVGNESNGTITDLDGKFTLTVPNGSELKFSYVGLKEEIAKAVDGMKVYLSEEGQVMDEVVIVGTVMRKSDLTGSVAMIDSKALSERPVTSVNEALQGRMAGVSINTNANPADDSSIKVRGINTINSGSEPIYIVDGQVMTNDFGGFSSINPNDVENIQVLKDASATALYGSRGANGVVLITTKKAKKGEGYVTYDGWVSLTSVCSRPSTMNAQQLGHLRVEAFANGYMMSNPDANRQAYIDNTLLGTNLAFSEEELNTYRSGKSYNWLDQNLRTGVQHNHTVSFAKGAEKNNVYLSLNYSGVNGILGNSSQSKYNGRINADTEINSWLKVGTSTYVSYQSDDMNDNTVFTKSLAANPLLDYAPYQDPATAYDANHQYWYYQAMSSNYNNEFNPFTMKDVQYQRMRSHITSTNYLNIKFMEGLNFRSTLAVDLSNQKWFEYLPSNSPTSVRNEPQTPTRGDARAKQERWSRNNWQWDNTITFDHTWNQVHHLNALIGTSATKTIGDYTKAQGMRFASDELGYKDLGGASKFESTEIDSDFYTQTLLSYLVRGNYVYANKYYITATARYDGSSKFASGNQWGLLPSFSLAWDIRQEKFMDKADWLDRLKLRVGFGIVGNQDIENYAYNTWYYQTANRTTVAGSTVGVAGISGSTNRGTKNLTWEKQKQWNVGVDFSVLNRLSFSLDFFHIVNDDLLMQHSLPSTSGYSTTWENIGQVTNNGIEASVQASLVTTKDFSWNMGFNVSHDKNKVTKLYGDVKEILNGTSREGNIFLDKSLHTLYTLQCGGIATEANRSQWEGINQNGHTVGIGDLFMIDQNDDKKISEQDRVVVGKTDPKVYGGLNTDFSYKGFRLNAVFTYSLGAKKISPYYEDLISSVGLSQASTDLLDAYSSTNTNGAFPRRVTNTSSYNGWSVYDCDFAVQKADYLRLSTLSLSYNFSSKLLSPLHLGSLRLYATANNLFCITQYKGFDPETGDYGYPPCRSYTLGLNVSF